MPLRVIKLAASLAVSERWRRLAGIKACCPAAVMRLQTQSAIFFVLGHLQELFRKFARVRDTIGILLPDAEDGHEALTLGAVPLAELARSLIGLVSGGRSEALDREKRNASRQLQLD